MILAKRRIQNWDIITRIQDAMKKVESESNFEGATKCLVIRNMAELARKMKFTYGRVIEASHYYTTLAHHCSRENEHTIRSFIGILKVLV